MATNLIAGGCGFIGSNLAVAFRKRGGRLVALDNLSRKGSEILKDRIVAAGAEFVCGDIRTRCGGGGGGPWQLGKQDQGFFTYWLISHMLERPLSHIGFGGGGKQVRDLLHIDDLVDLALLHSRRIAEFRGEVFLPAVQHFPAYRCRRPRKSACN